MTATPTPILTPTAPTSDPLAQLRGIHLPDAIGFWPPAPGWWLLAAVIIAALFWVWAWLWKKYQHKKYRNVYRQQARTSLEKAYQQFKHDKDTHTYLHQCHTLLRRTALHHYPEQRKNIAPLAGKDWFEFLDSCCDTPVFGAQLAEEVEHSHYKPMDTQTQEKNPINPLHKAALRWLEKHQ